MTINIVIVGEGGHSKVISDVICSLDDHCTVGYLDNKYDALHIKGQTYYGPVSSVSVLLNQLKNVKLVIAIGNNHVRKAIVERLGMSDDHYVTLIHQSAVVSPSASVGSGTVIMPKAVVNANSKVGRHSIINTGAVVEHDNSLGDFVHISPNVTLAGTVDIEDGVHIGAGATVIPNCHIGEWTVIGAGATVINHIPSSSTAVGVPAKVINKKNTRGVSRDHIIG